MQAPIAVTIVTGFLGAGKSTLVERWLAELPKEQTAVIVNEQGDVGIDGALLASRVSRLREITGGCICCETQAELGAALAELADIDPAPTRIVVETSGAASPAGVIRVLTRGRARNLLRLDGVITVVDATRAERALRFDLAIEQLGFADVVLMSHVDHARDVDLDALEDELAGFAPGAVLARAERGCVLGMDAAASPLVELLAQREQTLRMLPQSDRASGGRRHTPIDAVALAVPAVLDPERFGDWVESALGAVEARVLRVKGILAVKGVDERVILQGVGEAIEVTLGPPWAEGPRSCRLVVLGLGLDREGLEAGFASCIAERV